MDFINKQLVLFANKGDINSHTNKQCVFLANNGCYQKTMIVLRKGVIGKQMLLINNRYYFTNNQI